MSLPGDRISPSEPTPPRSCGHDKTKSTSNPRTAPSPRPPLGPRLPRHTPRTSSAPAASRFPVSATSLRPHLSPSANAVPSGGRNLQTPNEASRRRRPSSGWAEEGGGHRAREAGLGGGGGVGSTRSCRTAELGGCDSAGDDAEYPGDKPLKIMRGEDVPVGP